MEIENCLEGNLQQHHDGNLNEWGEYIRNRDSIFIDRPGVIEAIRNNDPAITSVYVHIEFPHHDDIQRRILGEVDWEAAGQCLGNSKHVKHLNLHLEARVLYGAEIRAFCRGLNQNQSIEMLQIYCEDNTTGVFQFLLPFFANNTKLVLIDMEIYFSDDHDDERFHDTYPNCIENALQACQFLKAIKISSYRDLGSLTAICGIIGLHHLYLDIEYISKFSWGRVCEMLSDENNQLKSLSFGVHYWPNYNSYDLTAMANALAKNKSVQCIRIKFTESVYLKQKSIDGVKAFLLRLRKGVPLNILLEQLFHFGPSYKASLSLSVIQERPELKSLCVEKSHLDSLNWKTLVSYVTSSNSLHKLSFSVSDVIKNDDTFQNFANYLATKVKLKVLDISTNKFTSTAWVNLFASLKSSTLEEISVSLDTRCITMMTDLSQFMASNQQVRLLKIRDDVERPINSEGWLKVMTVLSAHKSIEEIDITTTPSAFSGDVDIGFADLLSNSNIKRLCLHISSTAQLQLVADAIASPNCFLEELQVHYFGEDSIELSSQGWGNQYFNVLEERAREQLTPILVDSLHRNRSIKVLKFYHKDINDEFEFKFNWSSFTNLLCNKSSLDATYLSNHVLQSIQLHSGTTHYGTTRNEVPIELYSLLHLNQNTDKCAVARKKILQTHSLVNIEFETSSLPNVISCVGDTDSLLSLSQLYGVLRKVPHLVRKNQMKRKLQEL